MRMRCRAGCMLTLLGQVFAFNEPEADVEQLLIELICTEPGVDHAAAARPPSAVMAHACTASTKARESQALISRSWGIWTWSEANSASGHQRPVGTVRRRGRADHRRADQNGGARQRGNIGPRLSHPDVVYRLKRPLWWSISNCASSSALRRAVISNPFVTGIGARG